MRTYRPKVRANSTVIVGGHEFHSTALGHSVGQKVEVQFSPIYPEAGAQVLLGNDWFPLFAVPHEPGTLLTVSEIKQAIRENEHGRGGIVMARLVDSDDPPLRIFDARTYRGELEVKTLRSGRWVGRVKRVWTAD